MKKVMDFIVKANLKRGDNYSLLKLAPVKGNMPQVKPGQFVQVEVPNSKSTYLRRPISINYADSHELWLLVRRAGAGTASLCNAPESSVLSVVLPLGNGFTTDVKGTALLIGGGVGTAPLLMLGSRLAAHGVDVHFLLGARSMGDLLQLDLFRQTAEVHVATEDGSLGHKGLVTTHPVLRNENITHIACCGPMPMMKAVAAIARERGINCEVSLENMMACGLGACLCCVEDTKDEGNVCVCTEGPVFNINRLKW
ncbi:MAG: dihydroorotate dehydrogenase electron transfer subunit [Muribaculaceae bacterium]|nr:dihydroorotate dehydrogenase electron transfer subunit [Muribaculaceae bacterium]